MRTKRIKLDIYHVHVFTLISVGIWVLVIALNYLSWLRA